MFHFFMLTHDKQYYTGMGGVNSSSDARNAKMHEVMETNRHLRDEVRRCRGKVHAILRDSNVEEYLRKGYNKKSVLDETFEKMYLRKYHDYLKTIVSAVDDDVPTLASDKSGQYGCP